MSRRRSTTVAIDARSPDVAGGTETALRRDLSARAAATMERLVLSAWQHGEKLKPSMGPNQARPSALDYPVHAEGAPRRPWGGGGGTSKGCGSLEISGLRPGSKQGERWARARERITEGWSLVGWDSSNRFYRGSAAGAGAPSAAQTGGYLRPHARRWYIFHISACSTRGPFVYETLGSPHCNYRSSFGPASHEWMEAVSGGMRGCRAHRPATSG